MAGHQGRSGDVRRAARLRVWGRRGLVDRRAGGRAGLRVFLSALMLQLRGPQGSRRPA